MIIVEVEMKLCLMITFHICFCSRQQEVEGGRFRDSGSLSALRNSLEAIV